MKLIIAVDAIFPPLTGIGRYALELVRGLQDVQEQGELGQIRYFSHGAWVDAPAPGLLQQQASGVEPPQPAPSPGLTAWVRTRLARNRHVVSLYATFTQPWFKWRLRGYADYLFHAPNFILPPFAGRSIATIHDLSTVLYPQFHPAARIALMDRMLPQTLQRASHLITVSETVREEIIRHYQWPRERITATPLGVSPAYRPMAELHTRPVLQRHGLEHGAYILCVATLEPRKNIERLIEAFSRLPPMLRQRYPLVLAGAQGWGCETLHDLIRKCGIRYLRYLPEHELPVLYAGAWLFAFPSIYEGFGLPVLEAMASGVPVLTSNCSSMPEVSAGAGLLVDPLDTDAIRDGLVRGLEDGPWRATAIERGLTRAGQLTWGSCVGRTLDLYRSLATSSW